MRRKNLENAMTLIEEELRKSTRLQVSTSQLTTSGKPPRKKRVLTTLLFRRAVNAAKQPRARAAHIADPEVHPHRTELPVGVEHVGYVGLVWISATGEPPEFNGIRLTGKEGNIVNMPGHQINPTLFAAFFPLLNPKGVLGYSWGIPLKSATITADQATPKEILQDVEDDEDNEVHLEEDDEHEADSQQDDHQVDELLDREVRGWTARPPREGPRQFVSQRQFWRYLIHPRGLDMQADHWLFSHEQLADTF
ncbi:hypothetical protein L596_001950 [Steinernema carpocapsae]|uniref:Uncharacterized protein n=1 Tax=Steinernema carpocapsae TaxID=34508 RepID=A0A4U8UN24_STECR|nr:hypothetical protein L596_001950 [Steinernema carpocapsae]